MNDNSDIHLEIEVHFLRKENARLYEALKSLVKLPNCEHGVTAKLIYPCNECTLKINS